MRLVNRIAACAVAAVLSLSMLTACGGGESVALGEIAKENSFTYKTIQTLSGDKSYIEAEVTANNMVVTEAIAKDGQKSYIGVSVEGISESMFYNGSVAGVAVGKGNNKIAFVSQTADMDDLDVMNVSSSLQKLAPDFASVLKTMPDKVTREAKQVNNKTYYVETFNDSAWYYLGSELKYVVASQNGVEQGRATIKAVSTNPNSSLFEVPAGCTTYTYKNNKYYDANGNEFTENDMMQVLYSILA